MTFEAYKIEVQVARSANPQWRLGQAAFNVLWIERPDLSEQIRGTSLDPFYTAAKLPKFYEWVEQHWNSK